MINAATRRLVRARASHHPQGEGYQTSINRALREYVAQQQS